MAESGELVECDNIGCTETYPRFHKEMGPWFLAGKWPGWLYLDINRPDLSARPLRFCGMRCLLWWIAESRLGFQMTVPFQDTARDLLAYGVKSDRDKTPPRRPTGGAA